jgi:hypothetical protein
MKYWVTLYAHVEVEADSPKQAEDMALTGATRLLKQPSTWVTAAFNPRRAIGADPVSSQR